MNKLFALIILAVLCISCHSNDKPELFLETNRKEMDTLYLNESYDIPFVIKNTGNKDLVIDTVSLSCDCTTPNFSKKNLSPGDTASLVINYTPIDTGSFKKTAVIRSNSDSVFSIVYFSGYIKAK